MELSGASLSVMGSLQDELFNFSIHKIRLQDVFTDAEVKASLYPGSNPATDSEMAYSVVVDTFVGCKIQDLKLLAWYPEGQLRLRYAIIRCRVRVTENQDRVQNNGEEVSC